MKILTLCFLLTESLLLLFAPLAISVGRLRPQQLENDTFATQVPESSDSGEHNFGKLDSAALLNLPMSFNPKAKSDEFCEWAISGPPDDVCFAISQLGLAVHSGHTIPPTELQLEFERSVEEEFDISDAWPVVKLDITTDPLNETTRTRRAVREAIYAAKRSFELNITASSLADLGRVAENWSPSAVLRFGRNNVGVVYTSIVTATSVVDVIVGIRSTMSPYDESINMRVDQVTVPLIFNTTDVDYGSVHNYHSLGVHKGYNTVAIVLMRQLRFHLAKLFNERRLGRVIIGGYSMGGGIAPVLAIHLLKDFEFGQKLENQLEVLTFGAPRFGDPNAVVFLEDKLKVYDAVVAQGDIISRFPCRIMPLCSDVRIPTFFHSPAATPTLRNRFSRSVLRSPVIYWDNNRAIVFNPGLNESLPAMMYHSTAYGIYPVENRNVASANDDTLDIQPLDLSNSLSKTNGQRVGYAE